MNISILAAVIFGSYCVGAISFARIIGKRVIPEEDLENLDISIEGKSDHFRFQSISATVIRRKAGTKYGCLTSILDMLKAFIPTLALKLLLPDQPYHLFAAAFSVIGHNFPIYYRFRGGRGMSPIYGSLFVIDWMAIPVTTLIGSIIGVVIFRYLLLAYFGVTLLMLPWLWFRTGGDIYHIAYALIINISFWIASIPEIKEYIAHKKSGDFSQDHYFIHPDKELAGPLLNRLRERREKRKRSS